jgi:lysosomal Pro-X carboxypeptidase
MDVSSGFALRNFSQLVDHFNCLAAGNETFTQRYLLRDAGWRNSSPIFVFTGAEGGDVTHIIGDYGSVLALAAKLGAMVVAIEGRFFGKSLPADNGGGGRPAANSTIGVLSVEQMIEDYAAIIESIRDERGAGGWSSPVFTFGGSLAGTLAVLTRLSRPWLVDAAFASSAPLLGWVGQTDPFAWRARVTATWEEAHAGCSGLVRRGFAGLARLDPPQVAATYHTCGKAFKGNGAAVRALVWEKLETHGEFVYGVGLPTLAAACKRMAGAGPDDGAVFARFLDVGPHKCLNLTRHMAGSASVQYSGGARGGTAAWVDCGAGAPHRFRGWSYLSCTQVIHPIGANNVTDFFPPFNWSVDGLARECAAEWGIQPRPLDLPFRYGLQPRSLARSASRVLFSYGTRDPWATMGVGWRNLSEALPVVAVEGGSHCADVAVDMPTDSEAMLRARRQQGQILSRWAEQIASERRQGDGDAAHEGESAHSH